MLPTTCKAKDLDTIIRTYYQHTEIGNAEIKELFGSGLSTSTLARLKKMARVIMTEGEVIRTARTKAA